MRAPSVKPSELHLRRSLRLSANRHWFARMVIASSVLLTALFAFFSPESLLGRAIYLSGDVSFWLMLALAALALGQLVDVVIHQKLPGRLQYCLMLHRHGATMCMAILLVVEGGGLAVTVRQPLILVSFLQLAFFCVLLTVFDLFALRSNKQ